MNPPSDYPTLAEAQALLGLALNHSFEVNTPGPCVVPPSPVPMPDLYAAIAEARRTTVLVTVPPVKLVLSPAEVVELIMLRAEADHLAARNARLEAEQAGLASELSLALAQIAALTKHIEKSLTVEPKP